MGTTLRFRRIWSIFILSMLFSVRSRAAAGDPPEFTYHVQANEVRLTFSATDQNHRAVATLKPADFAVVDKELIVRDFQSFSRADSKKLEIGIVIDLSGSVAPRFRREISDLVDLISQTAGIPEENISIFSFRDSHPALLCSNDCRTSHAAEQLSRPRPGDLTPLFDTVIFASDFLAQHADRDAQKILILISDGQDSASRAAFRKSLETAMKQAVQIYGIDLNGNTSSQGSAVLFALANQTGGRYFSGARAPQRAMDEIFQDFRSSYTITYKVPTSDAGFHELRILPTHNQSLEFRSRSGYYYPDNLH